MDDSEFFNLVKIALYSYVKGVYGWDDEFQKRRIKESYAGAELNWIDTEGIRKDLVCYRFKPNSLHVHLLLIKASYQGCGIGGAVMEKLHKQAIVENLPVTLSCFKQNKQALQFYSSLGYQVVSEDDHF